MMFSSSVFPSRLIILVFSGIAAVAQAGPSEELSFERFKSSSAEVRTEILPDGSLQVDLAAGAKGSPGAIVLPPSGEAWDLAKFSRIEAVIQNTGDLALPVSLRVDNKAIGERLPGARSRCTLNPVKRQPWWYSSDSRME
jgi:hypothetical protein